MNTEANSDQVRLERSTEGRRVPFTTLASIAAISALFNLTGCGADTSSDTSSAESSAAPTSTENPSQVSKPARSSVEDNPAGWPPIEFEPPELHLGILPPGGHGGGTARIHNVGNTPLHIIRSRPSCSCVSHQNLAGRVIPPGGSIDFEASMSMKSGLGEKKQRVVIIFDGYNTMPVSFFIKAEVSLPIQVTPPHITAVPRADGGEYLSGVLRVASQDGEPFRVLGANDQPPIFKDFDPNTDALRNRYTLIWDLDGLDAAGRVPWFWVIETDHPEAPVVDVRVRHLATKPSRQRDRPWQPRDQRFLIGNITPYQPVEITTKIEFSGNVRPSLQGATVRSDAARMDVRLVDLSVDGQFLAYRIEVTPRSDQAGLFYEQFTLQHGRFTVPIRIIGRLVE